MKRVALLVGLLMLLILPVGLVATAHRAEAQMGTAVSISNFSFQPAAITVAAGTTVTWTNFDGAPHTVSADNGSFDSGTIGSGGSYSLTFTAPGTYTYHCNIHPSMTGVVYVSGM